MKVDDSWWQLMVNCNSCSKVVGDNFGFENVSSSFLKSFNCKSIDHIALTTSASIHELVAEASNASDRSLRHPFSCCPVSIKWSFSARLIDGAKLTNLLNRCFGSCKTRVGWLHTTVAVRGTSFSKAISPNEKPCAKPKLITRPKPKRSKLALETQLRYLR